MGGDGSFPDEVKSMRNDVPLLPHSPPFHRRSKWGLSSRKTQNNHRAKGNHKVRERKKKKKKNIGVEAGKASHLYILEGKLILILLVLVVVEAPQHP